MSKSVRSIVALSLGLLLSLGSLLQAQQDPQRFARFQVDDEVHYGRVEGDQIRVIAGNLFARWELTDRTFPLKSVELLVPTTPKHVFAMAGNYRSHLTKGPTTTTITTTTTVSTDPDTQKTSTESQTETEVRVPGEVPPKFAIPQPFLKTNSSLVADGGTVILPKGATTVHYEAEMVIVIGRRARNVAKDAALDYVFGVTCGNDISARVWQKNDVQWWRAKGSDTFGPCGPFIATGLDYDNLTLQLELNGEVVQKESTSQLIHDVASTVAFISQHVTLEPGDLIFTGTPGQTAPIKPGDKMVVALEGVGRLTNPVAAEAE